MVADRCAGCGKELSNYGLRKAGTMRCCSGAYWSRHQPLPRDHWYPIKRREGWCLYGEFLPDAVLNWQPESEKPRT